MRLQHGTDRPLLLANVSRTTSSWRIEYFLAKSADRRYRDEARLRCKSVYLNVFRKFQILNVLYGLRCLPSRHCRSGPTVGLLVLIQQSDVEPDSEINSLLSSHDGYPRPRIIPSSSNKRARNGQVAGGVRLTMFGHWIFPHC